MSPAQNFLNPPPVPDTPTTTRVFGLIERYSSATASVIGKTVLDPSIVMVPLLDALLLVEKLLSFPPHEARNKAAASMEVVPRRAMAFVCL